MSLFGFFMRKSILFCLPRSSDFLLLLAVASVEANLVVSWDVLSHCEAFAIKFDLASLVCVQVNDAIAGDGGGEILSVNLLCATAAADNVAADVSDAFCDANFMYLLRGARIGLNRFSLLLLFDALTQPKPLPPLVLRSKLADAPPRQPL